VFEDSHVSEVFRPHAAAPRAHARLYSVVIGPARERRSVTPIHDLTLYAAAHPWALTAALLLILIVLIATLVWLWQRQAEEILCLYRQPDDSHRIDLENGRFRLDIVRRHAGWRFQVTCRDHDLKPGDVVVTTIRPDGLGQRFDFARRGRRLESMVKVREPLIFVAHVSISWGGIDSTFVIGFGGAVAPIRARSEVIRRPETASDEG
jgi:hypothetical protein